jgi:hypothetical protein
MALLGMNKFHDLMTFRTKCNQSGEMHFIPSTVDSWYNLPRRGGIAYAAQESWVQNETIRENILFGSPYDEERYRKGIIKNPISHLGYLIQ